MMATEKEMESIEKEMESIKKEYEEGEKYIKVLLAGKTGSGKSTLANSILGIEKESKVEEHRSVAGPGTLNMNKYEEDVNGVSVTVWDCPGLQDGTENQESYMQQIQDQCSERDITLYCIQCGGVTRFLKGNDDVLAMKQLTKRFGNHFWENTIIFLTFSDLLSNCNKHWKTLSPDAVKNEFESIIKEWEDLIHKSLIEEVNLPQEIANQVPIVPAGHYSEEDLPGIEHWLSVAWAKCLKTVKSNRARASLITQSEPRFESKRLNQKTVTDELYKQDVRAAAAICAGGFITSATTLALSPGVTTAVTLGSNFLPVLSIGVYGVPAAAGVAAIAAGGGFIALGVLFYAFVRK